VSYEAVAGDRGRKIIVTVQRHPGEVMDLTGKTVHVRYRISGAAAEVRQMTVLDQGANPGQAEYTFLQADLAAGDLVGEIVVQLGQADQVTAPDTFILPVRDPLG
jgi:hypothetical protein